MKGLLRSILVITLLLLLFTTIPAQAQSNQECTLTETHRLDTDLTYALFGAGSLEETSIVGNEQIALIFRVVEANNACPGNRPALLILTTGDSPYHLRINNAWVSFSGQVEFTINITTNVLSISVLRGSAAVFKGDEDVILIPTGYSMYATLRDEDTQVIGYWGGQTPMQGVDRENLHNLETQNTDVIIEVPTNEQIGQSQQQYGNANTTTTSSSNGGAQGSSVPAIGDADLTAINCTSPDCMVPIVNTAPDQSATTRPDPCNGCEFFIIDPGLITNPDLITNPIFVVPIQPIQPIEPIQPILPPLFP